MPNAEEVCTPATPVRDDTFANRRQERLQEHVQGALSEKGPGDRQNPRRDPR
jgi:hypothetical protein